MKRHTLVLTLIASTSLALTAAEDPNPTSSVNPSPSATPDGGGPRCTLNSDSVEVHTYYGTRKTLTEKVSQMPFDLSERRVFLQATQRGKTDSALTDVKLFERQKDGSLAIT